MGRLSRGWQLAKIALGVVRSDTSLLTITILGGAAAICAALALGYRRRCCTATSSTRSRASSP